MYDPTPARDNLHMFREFTADLNALNTAAETVADYYESYVSNNTLDRDSVICQRVDTIIEELAELDTIAAGTPPFQSIRHIDDMAWFIEEVQNQARTLAAGIRDIIVGGPQPGGN